MNGFDVVDREGEFDDRENAESGKEKKKNCV